MSLPPYPKYKNSGVACLGEVPEGWEVKRLKNLASIQNGADYKHIQVDREGYPVIGSGGEFARASKYLYDGESVLLGRKGTIDKPLYIKGAFWPVDTMFYTKINQETCAKYLYYCALTIKFDLYSTSTALPSMTQADLSNIHFAVPDFVDQSTIAAFLDRETAKIDALVAEQEKLISLLAEKRQATISHAVTKGLDPNAPMKDSGVAWLGEVPEGWEVKPLKFLVSFSGGGTPSRDNLEYWNGNIPWVSPKDMKQERIASAEESITELGLKESSTILQCAGQVLMVVRSGILKHTIPVAINDEPVALNQDMKALFFGGKEWLSEFFLRWVQGLNDQLLKVWLKQGATVESVEHQYLAETIFPFPCQKECLEIVDFLKAETARLDALTAEATRGIALLKERRAALISAAVTGKIDVRSTLQTEAL